MNKDFILEDFDRDNLSGHARTSCDNSTSALSELEVISQACKSKSEQMPEGYKIEHDGGEFCTCKKRDALGQSITDIHFGFEIKTDD